MVVLRIDASWLLLSELHRCLELYRELDFAVIPLAYGEKTPAIPSWKEYQARKPTDEEISFWFSRRSNIGVVTGAVSANLTVLDFDEPNAFTCFFGAHEELVKKTLTVRTGKGIHVYLRSFKSTPSFKISKLKLDVKGEGSYVVAPPSLHPSGSVYRFENPDVQDVLLVPDVANEVRRRAFQLGALAPTSPRRTASPVRASTVTLNRRHIASIVRLLAPYWIPGYRNDLACALLGYLIKKGVDEESAYIVIDQLTAQAGDEEREARLRLVRYHYQDRIRLGSKLRAVSGIRDIIASLRGI